MKPFLDEPFTYHQEIELQIETITNQGHGLGRVQDWVVMVKFALPGERVRVRIFKNHKNYSEADLMEVITPSLYRVQPLCGLFRQCGGCQYQHLDYAQQLWWKQKHVEETFQRLAGVNWPAQPTWPSPKPYHYRAKLTPHFEKLKGNSMPIGFLKEGRRRELVDVPHCPLATPAINEALTQERKRIQAGACRLRRGGTLLLRDTDNGVVLQPQSIVSQRVGQQKFEFVAGEFFQNNPYILPDFVAYVVAQAQSLQAHYLIDAYCGVGLFGIAAAHLFQAFVGVEVNIQAIELARRNAACNQISNSEFVLGQSECIFKTVTFPAQDTVIILDPPRKGCDGSFLEQLVAYRPKGIVYVACDVATQARDVHFLLQHQYQIQAIQPFDLFPQTKHIENVVTLTAMP